MPEGTTGCPDNAQAVVQQGGRYSACHAELRALKSRCADVTKKLNEALAANEKTKRSHAAHIAELRKAKSVDPPHRSSTEAVDRKAEDRKADWERFTIWLKYMYIFLNQDGISHNLYTWHDRLWQLRALYSVLMNLLLSCGFMQVPSHRTFFYFLLDENPLLADTSLLKYEGISPDITSKILDAWTDALEHPMKRGMYLNAPTHRSATSLAEWYVMFTATATATKPLNVAEATVACEVTCLNLFIALYIDCSNKVHEERMSDDGTRVKLYSSHKDSPEETCDKFSNQLDAMVGDALSVLMQEQNPVKTPHTTTHDTSDLKDQFQGVILDLVGVAEDARHTISTASWKPYQQQVHDTWHSDIAPKLSADARKQDANDLRKATSDIFHGMLTAKYDAKQNDPFLKHAVQVTAHFNGGVLMAGLLLMIVFLNEQCGKQVTSRQEIIDEAKMMLERYIYTTSNTYNIDNFLKRLKAFYKDAEKHALVPLDHPRHVAHPEATPDLDATDTDNERNTLPVGGGGDNPDASPSVATREKHEGNTLPVGGGGDNPDASPSVATREKHEGNTLAASGGDDDTGGDDRFGECRHCGRKLRSQKILDAGVCRQCSGKSCRRPIEHSEGENEDEQHKGNTLAASGGGGDPDASPSAAAREQHEGNTLPASAGGDNPGASPSAAAREKRKGNTLPASAKKRKTHADAEGLPVPTFRCNNPFEVRIGE